MLVQAFRMQRHKPWRVALDRFQDFELPPFATHHPIKLELADNRVSLEVDSPDHDDLLHSNLTGRSAQKLSLAQRC